MLIFLCLGKPIDSDRFIDMCAGEYQKMSADMNTLAFDGFDTVIDISAIAHTSLHKKTSNESKDICAYQNELIVDRAGKPKFFGSALKFNLTHTEGLTAAAMSRREVGIDAEKIRKIDFSKFKFLGDFESERDFFDAWTAKEAAIKLSGGGISEIRKDLDLTSITVRKIPVGAEFSLSVAEYKV